MGVVYLNTLVTLRFAGLLIGYASISIRKLSSILVE
jgi:hypothetical protein